MTSKTGDKALSNWTRVEMTTSVARYTRRNLDESAFRFTEDGEVGCSVGVGK